ncbi:MAG: cell division protein FtsW [Candidatus Sungbacteria bacterium RIFCSPHIGHO2_02_FULL_49_20]|uniref:Probable peptidoglycan glycosyltransferase FtsW n=1 Tax=Candidatus Sungbacteria bacterium RIFCSPHIGHO2_02_FULL_49_20 TaxID=1802272 RepID=A0A1G2KP00_9BACT|nr:MAG: cell division protein FtsW [Candidatus Sungbacteria bacterium RIFCSPHIGHO2_02_FULL_49_20]
MRTRRFADISFLITIGLLVLAGIFFLSSASTAVSAKKFDTIYYYTLRQLLWVAVGIISFFIAQAIPYRWYKAATPFFFAAALMLLGLVFVPGLGVAFGGARRWINLGFTTVQPAELAKLATVLALAWWYDRIRQKILTLSYGLLPTLAIIGAAVGLIILQPDLGTAIIITGAALAVYLVAGAHWRHILICIGLGFAALLILMQIAPYRLNRLTVFIHPETDPLGIGFQVRQAAISIGSGGFWGLGYGSAQQRPNFLPEPIGDSIFAIIGEEFGFVGVVVLISLYLIFLWRGIVIIRKADDLFAKLVGAGIITTIVTQAFINMGAISGLFPLTGVPLPFISYGGTSLVATFIGLGIVYQIAKKS